MGAQVDSRFSMASSIEPQAKSNSNINDRRVTRGGLKTRVSQSCLRLAALRAEETTRYGAEALVNDPYAARLAAGTPIYS